MGLGRREIVTGGNVRATFIRASTRAEHQGFFLHEVLSKTHQFAERTPTHCELAESFYFFRKADFLVRLWCGSLPSLFGNGQQFWLTPFRSFPLPLRFGLSFSFSKFQLSSSMLLRNHSDPSPASYCQNIKCCTEIHQIFHPPPLPLPTPWC